MEDVGMRVHRGVLAAVSLTVLAGCALPTAMPLAANLAMNDPISALARPAIGGAVYNAFRIQPQLPEGTNSRAAVKLTYLMNDDSAHQSPWSQKMLQMMDDQPQSQVHNVVFRDGGEMGDSRLYYMQQADTNPTTIRNPQSTLAPGVSEVQSNNPKVLSQILGWTLDHYQGKRKYLQIYTHGAGCIGLGTDEKQTDPSGKLLPKDQQLSVIPMPAFTEALRQALKGRQLDAIYFRACLMGNLEAMYELRGTTRYAIASEDVSYSVENSNITMTKLFDDLAARGTEPGELARQLSIAANAKSVKTKDGEHSGYTAMAAIDIGRLDELKSAINSLVVALKAAMPKQRDAITAAYDAVPAYNGKEIPEQYYEQSRDLWAFTAQLQQKVQDPAVQRAVDQVRQAQRQAMLHERDSFGSAANGLTIFMPARNSDPQTWQGIRKNRYGALRFTADSGWDEFIDQMLASK
jgi:hypothetical protein